MSFTLPIRDSRDCCLLRLPLELRNRVYQNLVSIKHTETPKDFESGCRSSTRYNWNVDPVIHRVNRQIYSEAREVMQRENKFVVIERAKELEQGAEDMGEENPAIMKYNVKLWPGKGTKQVDVPGERMRVRFARRGAKAEDLDIYVLLVEELRDFCVALSIFQSPDGSTYRTSGLNAHIQLLDPPFEEPPQVQDDVRGSLLTPLTKLRHFEDVTVAGMAPFVAKMLMSPLTQKDFDGEFANSTIQELIYSGDHARDIGHFDVATAYYQRASEYLHHFANLELDTFTQTPLYVLSNEFKIMQHRARNFIEQDEFFDALQVADIAIHVAKSVFEANETTPDAGPRVNAQGAVTKGALRKWMCQRIKEGAESCAHLIKAEDVGRCFYYRSIAGHCVGGREATEQADDDKFTGIGCCVVSETVGEGNVPKELLDLDARTMKRLIRRDRGGESGDEEWEDLEDEEEGEE